MTPEDRKGRPHLKARHAEQKAKERQDRANEALSVLEANPEVYQQWRSELKNRPAWCVDLALECIGWFPFEDQEQREIRSWMAEAAMEVQGEGILSTIEHYQSILDDGGNVQDLTGYEMSPADTAFADQLTGLAQNPYAGRILVAELVGALPLKGARGKKILRRLDAVIDEWERNPESRERPSHAPRLIDRVPQVLRVMAALWKRCFQVDKNGETFGWKELADDAEILRQQILGLSRDLCETITERWLLRYYQNRPGEFNRAEERERLREHWTPDDEARLERMLARDAVRNILSARYFLPFRKAPERSCTLAKAMFHVGRTASLRELENSVPAKLRRQK